MTCYPPEVYRDRLDAPEPKPRTRRRAASNAIVVSTRRVTHAGYVEVTTNV